MASKKAQGVLAVIEGLIASGTGERKIDVLRELATSLGATDEDTGTDVASKAAFDGAKLAVVALDEAGFSGSAAKARKLADELRPASKPKSKSKPKSVEDEPTEDDNENDEPNDDEPGNDEDGEGNEPPEVEPEE